MRHRALIQASRRAEREKHKHTERQIDGEVERWRGERSRGGLMHNLLSHKYIPQTYTCTQTHRHVMYTYIQIHTHTHTHTHTYTEIYFHVNKILSRSFMKQHNNCRFLIVSTSQMINLFDFIPFLPLLPVMR